MPAAVMRALALISASMAALVVMSPAPPAMLNTDQFVAGGKASKVCGANPLEVTKRSARAVMPAKAAAVAAKQKLRAMSVERRIFFIELNLTVVLNCRLGLERRNK